MNEAGQTMRNMQETLNRLLENLNSGDAARQLESLRDLKTMRFSSPAIRRRVEKFALGENAEMREAALDALKAPGNKSVASKNSIENRYNRSMLVKEIDAWETDGLIEPHRADILRRRYDFDMPAEEFKAPAEPKTAEPAPAPRPAPAQQEPARPAAPPAPRPSLTQVLLSETSVKIYLYLGAFFVIAAAAIWAALVEAARLPVLLAATFAFGAGAVVSKKRLPQPSFALAIVFSFLLPIDANVIAQQLTLSPSANETYWTIVFLVMAAIWGFGALFYASRMFSAAAFISLLFASLRFGEIFGASLDWKIIFVSAANLLGLLGVYFLMKWKGRPFSQPLSLLTQLTQLVLLAASFASAMINQFDGTTPGNWIAAALTWILAAFFYAASDLLLPSFFFPWMAAASLFPVPWLFLSAFDASSPAMLTGFAVWGALAAFASEVVQRADHPAWKKYHFPLLGLSLPLFVAAILISFDYSNTAIVFAAFLGAGVAYTLVHAIRPRWYVWLAALLFGLGAYFAFFSIELVSRLNVPFSYQLLGASLLLLVPELFFKSAFSFSRVWNWPPVVLGFTLVTVNLLTALGASVSAEYDRSAIVFGVDALLFAAYALRFKKPLIGYFASVSATVAVVFVLQFYDLDRQLPVLTALSTLYYAAGFFLARQERTKGWGSMLVISGLGLGGFLSILSLADFEPAGGRYALVIAALFLVEMFTRKNGYLEIFAEVVLSIALILFFDEFNVAEISYIIFGLSLLWFAADAVFKRAFQPRKLEFITQIIGTIFTLAATATLYMDQTSRELGICYGVYTVFFAAYAWLNKNPLVGYASTFFLALAVYFGQQTAIFEQWLFPQIALAAIYYAAGSVLRRAGRAKGWDSTLLFSGLGLGAYVAMLAPSQTGGLENAIPIAVAATLYAAEAFARRNAWLGFPANGFYLLSYFVILGKLNVDEPQFFTVGAAALGLLQHYLLRRAGQKSAAFVMGIVSQLVLLGTSYIQMADTGELKYFFLLFFQFLAMLAYGIVARSRILIIAPIAIVTLAILTILYNVLKDFNLVVIIGITGIVLLGFGILAAVKRERIANLAERFGDWEA